MSDNDFESVREEIEAEFENTDVDLDDHDIEEPYEQLREYQVPRDEAVQNIINTILDDEDLSESSMRAEEDDEMTLAGFEQDIEENGPAESYDDPSVWGTVEAKVVRVFNSSDAMHQKVVLGDETGELKFAMWSDYGELHDIELSEGDTIRVESAVGDYSEEYGHEIQTATKTDNNGDPVENATQVSFIDKDITVDTSVTITGPITRIKGEVFTKRCQVEEDGDVCGRALNDSDECPTHGAVGDEWASDVRVQANVAGSSDDLDGSRDTFSVQFQTEAAMTFLQAHDELDIETVDDAHEFVKDELDTGALNEYVEDMIHGEVVQLDTAHFNDSGSDELFLVNEWDFASVDMEAEAEKADELLEEARANL